MKNLMRFISRINQKAYKPLSQLRLLLPMLLLLPFISLAQYRLPIQELVGKSDIIMYAQVISIESRMVNNGGTGNIFTSIKLKVLQSIKGNLIGDEFSLDVPGGKSSDGTQSTNSIRFNLNESSIIFLQKDPANQNCPLLPIARVPVAEGRTIVEGHNVEANRFIEVLRKAVTDDSAIASFLEEISKESEAAKQSPALPRVVGGSVKERPMTPEERNMMLDSSERH